jgi:HEAT repeat protein
VFTSLLRIGDSDACDWLAELLRSQDPELRNGAIEVLGSLGEEAAPFIELLMSDADPDVRIFAINVMGALRFADVPKWLIQVVTSDAHVNVCCAAIDVLAAVGGPEGIDALQALIEKFPEEPYVAFAAQAAIEGIKRMNPECS